VAGYEEISGVRDGSTEETKLPQADTPPRDHWTVDDPAECDTAPTLIPIVRESGVSIGRIECSMPHGLLNGLDTINDRETMYDMSNKNITPAGFANTKYSSTDSLKIQDTCQFGREVEQQPDTTAEQVVSARGFTNLIEEEIKVPDQSPVKLSLAEE